MSPKITLGDAIFQIQHAHDCHMGVWAPHDRALGCPNIRWATNFHHLGMELRGQKPVCPSQNFAPVSCVKHLWPWYNCRGTNSSSLGLQPVVVLKSDPKWQLGPSTTFYHLRMGLWEQKPVYSSQNSAPVSCVKHLWCAKLERFCPHLCTYNRL